MQQKYVGGTKCFALYYHIRSLTIHVRWWSAYWRYCKRQTDYMHIITHRCTQKNLFCLYTEISTVINTYFIAVKWGQSQNNDVIISSKCIQEQRRHATYLVLKHKQYKCTCLKLGRYITVKREILYE